MPDSGLLASLTLARGGIDRAAERREDDAWFEQAWRDPATRVLVLHRGKARVRTEVPPADGAPEPARGSAGLVLVGPHEAGDDGVRVLLAVHDDVAHVALLLRPDAEPPEAPAGADGDVRWEGLREVGAALGDLDAGLLVAAVALAHWHDAHPRCPRCGAATEPAQAGWSRRCPDDGSQHFPRSDPAVIVLVRDDDDRALLGRRAEWPDGFFSTLAGFVEAGESAELTVVREMQEEAGVLVDRLDYLGSQPWPFPSSLMLGYHARLAPGSPEPRPDGTEITEVRWFTREEMLAGCEDGTVRIPPAISIARRLVEHWYGGPLPGSWARR
ncbi:MAG: NAD(+) diphosphatase [Frankiales bacterium]|nr:NAD(+) diphosphatase [Frankiales bacterium]